MSSDQPDLFSLGADTSDRSAGSEGGASPAGPAVEDLVVDLERSLLTDAVRRDRKQLTRLLDVRWRQVDAAGRTWTRREISDAGSSHAGVELEVLETRRLSDDVILLLWRATGPDGVSSLRSSIWQRVGDDWKQTFQQGTREP